MQQGSSAGSAGAVATLTDEQIIGLDPLSADDATSVAQGAPTGHDSVAQVARGGSNPGVNAESARPEDLFGADEENASGLPRENNDERGESNPGRPEPQNATPDPAWLRSLEAQPQGGREAAAEARAWRTAATDVAALDAAYFSADAGARSGLAARLYDSDPAAFRAMLAEGARMLSQRDPQALAELARQLGGPANAATPAAAAPAAPSLRAAAVRAPVAQGAPTGSVGGPEAFSDVLGSRQAAAQNPQGPVESSGEMRRNAGRPELQTPQAPANATPAFPADAYRSFEAATNDDVARRVNQAIDHTLSNTLPEGTGEGARRRIAADILQEVQATLAADRGLSRRVGETLRDWRFDAAARQQVASLLSGRARAVLPEVARRVVTEWTSSVLVSDRAKTARIEAAAARREVTGGRLPEPVPPSALRPRNIDYRRTSDDQILDM